MVVLPDRLAWPWKKAEQCKEQERDDDPDGKAAEIVHVNLDRAAERATGQVPARRVKLNIGSWVKVAKLRTNVNHFSRARRARKSR